MDFRFQGNFELPKKREEVYALLTDVERLVPLLPNLEQAEIHNDKEFTVQAKVGLAFMKSTAKIRMALSESKPYESALYKGTGAVAGEALALSAAFQLADEEHHTRVNWVGEANLAGRLPAAAANLLEPVARQSIRTLVDSIKTALA